MTKSSCRDFKVGDTPRLGHDKELRAQGRNHGVPHHHEGRLFHPLEHDMNRRSALVAGHTPLLTTSEESLCQCDLRSPAWSRVNAGCDKKKEFSPFPRETRSRRTVRHVLRSTVSCCAVVSEAQLGKMRDSLTPGYAASSKRLSSTRYLGC